MNRKKTLFLLILLLLFFASAPAMATVVRVSAAASMTEAVKALIQTFSADNPQISIQPNFASSGALTRQILQGAPADIYISANQKWMDYLLKKGAIVPETVAVFAHNELVFIGEKKSRIRSMKEIVNLSLIAIGSPGSVPAGQYAAQAMQSAGIYRQLQMEHKLVMAKDVRQALIYADRTEVNGAFVYRSDALLARNAVLLFQVPTALHDPIVYPLGLTEAGTKNSGALAFSTFLSGAQAAVILDQYGFTTDGEK